jgi:hypothetical protein
MSQKYKTPRICWKTGRKNEQRMITKEIYIERIMSDTFL